MAPLSVRADSSSRASDKVSAQQLARVCDLNMVAADKQFKRKRFKVTVVVGSINTDMLGNPYVTLGGGVNQFMEPQFELDDTMPTTQLDCRAVCASG